VVDTTMDDLSWLRKQVEQADTDLLREMVDLIGSRHGESHVGLATPLLESPAGVAERSLRL
jgi:hypothetical protein